MLLSPWMVLRSSTSGIQGSHAQHIKISRQALSFQKGINVASPDYNDTCLLRVFTTGVCAESGSPAQSIH